MSESGDRPGQAGHEDPTLGAFDAARDPWARPPEPGADETAKMAGDQPSGMVPPDQAPPSTAPIYQPPPHYEPPHYEQPRYEAPHYEAPQYQPSPTYGPPAYQQSSFEPPAYSPPGGEQPSFPGPGQQGSYDQPYGQPYSQPAYGAADPYQQPYQQYGEQVYGYGAPGYPAPGYPGAAYGYGGTTSSGKATAVMVLGIASLAMLCFYGLGVIPAIVSLAMAGSAQREIESSAGRLGGLGMVKAGRVLSWITIGLTVVIVVIIALAIAFAPDEASSYSGD